MADDNPYQTFISGTALVLLGTVFSLGFGFFTRAVLANLLGGDDYGLIALAFSVATTLTIIAQLGLKQGVTRNISQYDDESIHRDIALTGLLIAMGTSIMLCLIVIVAAPTIATQIFNKDQLTPLLRVFAVTIPLITLQRIIVSIFRGKKHASEQLLLEKLLAPISKFSFVFLAVILGYGVFGAAAAWTLSVGLSATVAVVLLRRRTAVFRSINFSPRSQSLLTFSFPLLFSSITWTVVQQADNILIGSLLAHSLAVGAYDAAFTLGRLITAVIGAFGFLFMPLLSEFHSNGDWTAMDRLYKTVTKWAAALTFPLYFTIILFPEVLLGEMFGAEFTTAARALQLVSTGFYFHVLTGLGGNALVSIGRTRVVFGVNFLGAVFNIGFNILLIPSLGITGAALTSALTYVMMNGIYVAVLRGHGVSPVSWQLLGPLTAAVPIVLVFKAMLISIITVRLWMLPIVALCFGLIYLAAFVITNGGQPEDTELIETIEERIGMDLIWLRQFLEAASR